MHYKKMGLPKYNRLMEIEAELGKAAVFRRQ